MTSKHERHSNTSTRISPHHFRTVFDCFPIFKVVWSVNSHNFSRKEALTETSINRSHKTNLEVSRFNRKPKAPTQHRLLAETNNMLQLKGTVITEFHSQSILNSLLNKATHSKAILNKAILNKDRIHQATIQTLRAEIHKTQDTNRDNKANIPNRDSRADILNKVIKDSKEATKANQAVIKVSKADTHNNLSAVVHSDLEPLAQLDSHSSVSQASEQDQDLVDQVLEHSQALDSEVRKLDEQKCCSW